MTKDYKPKPYFRRDVLLRVPEHRGKHVRAVELRTFAKDGHTVIGGYAADDPFDDLKGRRPRTEYEKRISEVQSAFTVVVDKAVSGFRCKIGLDRFGKLQVNFIDRHGYNFLHFDKYEIENLLAILLVQAGITYPKNKGVPKMYSIERIWKTKRGVYFIPKKFRDISEMIYYQYHDRKIKRMAMINKKYRISDFLGKHDPPRLKENE